MKYSNPPSTGAARATLADSPEKPLTVEMYGVLNGIHDTLSRACNSQNNLIERLYGPEPCGVAESQKEPHGEVAKLRAALEMVAALASQVEQNQYRLERIA